MAKRGRSKIFIEPGGAYTTVSEYATDGIDGETLIASTTGQTLGAAMNKARDDLGTIPSGGEKVRQVNISVRIE